MPRWPGYAVLVRIWGNVQVAPVHVTCVYILTNNEGTSTSYTVCVRLVCREVHRRKFYGQGREANLASAEAFAALVANKLSEPYS